MMREWLESLGMEKYATLFDENEVDFETLQALTEKDLADLGLAFGPRRKLLHALGELKPGRGRSSASEEATEQARVTASIVAMSNIIVAPKFDGERRQLTVMFCDLVGSTALSERLDPEDFRAIIRAYQGTAAQVIAQFEGHIAQYLGDGLLVYFGHPLAHEDDAARAVRAGLGIVAAMRALKPRDIEGQMPLVVRIGIHTGLVVVGEVGGGTRHEQLALGDTPNLAARLQTLAAPDTVLVSEHTRRLAGGSFQYADLGQQSLKGIAEPLRVWRITGMNLAASRFDAATQGALTPLVGREHEVAMLVERWQLAQEGEGQVVLLSGEPGIGKSRILSELRERLAVEGVDALRFQCSPYHVNSAFYPSIDNFERALKFGRDETAESKLDKLEALLVADYGLPLTDVRFIAAMLSIHCEDRYGVLTITPQKHKDETLRVLVDIVDAAARGHPTVLLFEDAHWADPTTLEVLDQIIERVRAIPLLIVLTHRPAFQARWSTHGHVTALNISKLTRAQSTAIIAKLVGGKALPSELLAQILAKTDGVPLFVEELTKAILESGELKETSERYEQVGTSRTVTVPATLRDSLMARLDRSSAVKEIAQVGAAIGREFSYELLAAVAPKAKPELDAGLDQLIESGLAFRRGAPPAAIYTFKHALVQDAAYDSLLKSTRQELHATIARALANHFPQTVEAAPELLAHHLTAAGQHVEAIDYWQMAGAHALKRIALKEAIAHLNHGMALIGTLSPSPARDGQELDLRTRLGTAWMALKGWGAPEVWASFHPALGLAKSLERRDPLLTIYYGLTTNVRTQGRIVESLPWVNEMLAAAETTKDSGFLIEAERAACATRFWMGDLAESRAHGDRVMALYHDVHHRHLADLTVTDPKTVAGYYASLGTWLQGFPDLAVQVAAASIGHSRRRQHPFDLGFMLTFGGQLFDFRGEPAQILARVEEAERLGRTHSLPFITDVSAQLMKGIAWIRARRIAEGVPLLQRALELWLANDMQALTPYFRAAIAEGLALGGKSEDGLRLIEENLTQIARPGWEERVYLAEFLRLKAWMLSLQGDLDGAEQNYQSSLAWAREQQAKSWELRTATSLARLWQSQGKHREAQALLAPIYGWFTEGFDTKDLKDAKAVLSELESPLGRLA